MWDVFVRGPRNPNRIIFVATALVGATVGIATVNAKWFFLAILGAAVIQCASYTLIRRWLPWKPLDLDHLGYIARLLVP